MTLLRRCGMCSLLILSASLVFANPKSTTFNAPVDDVFKAAKKAAAGHPIILPKDEGLKDLTDSGEEIKSFRFATSLQGVTFRVIAEISVEPLPDGTTKLKMFFHRDGPYVPSASLEVREQQLQNQLERKLSELEREADEYKYQYEDIHSIDIDTYVRKQKETHAREYAAKIQEIDQKRDAELADLAGMPTSSFSTMDAASDKFFNLVQQKLQGGTAKTTAGVPH